MKDEYIIINKIAIENRIKELEKEETFYEEDSIRKFAKITQLKKILSQSTPLIPEIKKAIEFGKDIRGEKSFINDNYGSPFIDYEDSTEETNNYILTLKLDI